MTCSLTFRTAAVLALTGAIACGTKDDAAPASTPRPIDLAPAAAAAPQFTDAPVAPAEPAAAPKAQVQKQRAPERAAEPEREVAAPPARAADADPTPAPAVAATASAPAPVPPPPPATGVIESGSLFALKPATKVCSHTHKVGDQFNATLSSPLRGTNGVEIPVGATAVLRLVEAPKNVQAKDSVRLAYDLLSIRVGAETYEVSARVTQSAELERVNTQSTTDKAKKVGAGAVIGAIAGRVLGGNTKGAVIGGAVGAAAGAAVAMNSEQFNGCLRDDGSITLALDRPLTIKLAQGAP